MDLTCVADLAAELEPFVRATPELIEARGLQRRTDSKFAIPADAAAAVVSKLGEHYAVLPAGENLVATYDTLYFDSPGLVFFHDHRRGRRLRQKVRIRHYPDRLVSFLEVKKRRNSQQTTKARAQRAFGNDVLDDEDLAFIESHTRVTEGLRPAARTVFRRTTLLSRVDAERATIDLDVTLSHGAEGVQFPGLAIIEVKQARYCDRTPVMRALHAAGYRSCWSSKYCTAIAVTRPKERMNRLLPGLRALKRVAS